MVFKTIRVIKWLFIICFALSIALIVTTYLLRNQILKRSVNAINNSLKVQVKVHGNISVSIFNHFPEIAVSFQDVEITGSNSQLNTDLLNAKEISLLLNPFQLWLGKNTINKILIADAHINLFTSSNGKINFDVFKNMSGSSDYQFEIEKLNLVRCNFIIDNRSSKYFAGIYCNNANVAGNFKDADFDITYHANCYLSHLILNGFEYLNNKSVSGTGSIQFQNTNRKFVLNECEMQVEKVALNVTGDIEERGINNFYNMNITTVQANIEQWISLLPVKFKNQIEAYQFTGNLNGSVSISGLLSKSSTPEIKAYLNFTDGNIQSTIEDVELSNISFNAYFNNGSERNASSSFIELKEFHANVSSDVVSGHLMIKNFINPILIYKIDASFDLVHVIPWLHQSEITLLQGNCLIKDFKYEGPLYVSKDFTGVKTSGAILISNGKLETSIIHIPSFSLSIMANNDLIKIISLNILGGKSDLNFTGNILKPFHWINHFVSDTGKNSSLQVSLVCQSNNFYPADFLFQSNASSPIDFRIISILSGSHLTVNINKFYNGNFVANHVNAQISLHDSTVKLNQVVFQFAQGSVFGNCSFDFSNPKQCFLNTKFSVSRVAVDQLFSSFNNFDQDALTDKNLKGSISCTALLRGSFNQKLDFNFNSLYCITSFNIENGELNNFDPIMAMSKYIKVDELKHIQFQTITNTIEIKDQKVFIPPMNIGNSALNISLSGTHRFNNEIDYHVKLSLAELLKTKYQNQSFSSFEKPETPNGILNLYLHLSGNAMSPLIEYDKQATNDKIETELKSEKQLFQTIMNQELQHTETPTAPLNFESPEQFEYFNFDDSTFTNEPAQVGDTLTVTQQHQKKSMDNFKMKLKPKSK